MGSDLKTLVGLWRFLFATLLLYVSMAELWLKFVQY
jgi:hypothetical protein